MIKLLIVKMLVATSCVVSPNPCHDMCFTTVIPKGHWNIPVSGQAWVNGHWVKTKVRTWSPVTYVQKCEG